MNKRHRLHPAPTAPCRRVRRPSRAHIQHHMCVPRQRTSSPCAPPREASRVPCTRTSTSCVLFDGTRTLFRFAPLCLRFLTGATSTSGRANPDVATRLHSVDPVLALCNERCPSSPSNPLASFELCPLAKLGLARPRKWAHSSLSQLPVWEPLSMHFRGVSQTCFSVASRAVPPTLLYSISFSGVANSACRPPLQMLSIFFVVPPISHFQVNLCLQGFYCPSHASSCAFLFLFSFTLVFLRFLLSIFCTRF